MTYDREPKQETKNADAHAGAPRRWGVPDGYVPPKLGPLPDHVDLGEHLVGEERTYLVAAPFLLQPSSGRLATSIRPVAGTPSPFRDQIGLDPEPVLVADAFALESPAESAVAPQGPPPPIQIRFKPSRGGSYQAVVKVAITGLDGTIDTRQFRISGKAREPKVANEPRQPDNLKAADTGFDKVKPSDDISEPDLASAKDAAEEEAQALAGHEMNGLNAGAYEIASYKRAPKQPDMFQQLLEIAFALGVSGVASIVSKYVAKELGQMLARPPQTVQTIHPISGQAPAPGAGASKQIGHYLPATAPNPHMTSEPAKAMSSDKVVEFMTGRVEEGLKASAKLIKISGKPIVSSNSSGAARQTDKTDETGDTDEMAPSRTPFSTDQRVDTTARYASGLVERAKDLRKYIRRLARELKVADPEDARIAMQTLAQGFNVASQSAEHLHARMVGLQWISAVAKDSLGTERVKLADGSATEATRMDAARDAGPRSWVKETSAPSHDGLLDIHVDLPPGDTPVEMGELKVRSASLTGVAQSLADRLPDMRLRDAGIPIRFIVHGHPALITRDELGRVRINGYLLTKDAQAAGRTEGTGVKWTEAHMHQGAKVLVDRILSKTLAEWGIEGLGQPAPRKNRIKTDDASDAAIKSAKSQ